MHAGFPAWPTAGQVGRQRRGGGHRGNSMMTSARYWYRALRASAAPCSERWRQGRATQHDLYAQRWL